MKRFTSLLTVCLAVLAGPEAAQAAAAPPMIPADETVEIAERVYLIPDKGIPLVPNVGIIVGEEGDAGIIEEVREYLRAIQTRARELQARGVDLSAAQDTLHAEFTERYPGWGEPHWIRNTVERVYAEADPN